MLQTTEPTGDARALTVLLESRVAELQGRVAELDTEAKEGRAALARVSVLEALLEAERARVEEWKAVADRNNLASLLQDQGLAAREGSTRQPTPPRSGAPSSETGRGLTPISQCAQ